MRGRERHRSGRARRTCSGDGHGHSEISNGYRCAGSRRMRATKPCRTRPGSGAGSGRATRVPATEPCAMRGSARERMYPAGHMALGAAVLDGGGAVVVVAVRVRRAARRAATARTRRSPPSRAPGTGATGRRPRAVLVGSRRRQRGRAHGEEGEVDPEASPAAQPGLVVLREHHARAFRHKGQQHCRA